MRFKSLETTPNPNSMKLNFHDHLGAAVTYSIENKEQAPQFVKDLLVIDGVNSVFVCNDFVTLIRVPNKDWKPIMEKVSTVFGVSDDESLALEIQESNEDVEVQAQVFVQTFKGIPIQVKVASPSNEARVSLPPRFNQACMELVDGLNADFLKERYWDDRGIRYGKLEDIANEVADEIQGLITEEKLKSLAQSAMDGSKNTDSSDSNNVDYETRLEDEDWHVRLGAIQALSESNAPSQVLAKSARDEHPQVRRLVAAALGMTEDESCLPVLCDMLLNDQSVGVRRTAGDALSDIGSSDAEPEVVKALSDPNKLVRWRACRFLNEVGTQASLPYLAKLLSDKEYEVKVEAKAAMDRIQTGKKGSMPVWKQISSTE